MLDRDHIKASVAAVLGDSVRLPDHMVLGHPETGEVWVASPEHAGQVWVHRASEAYPTIETNPIRTDDQTGVTTALLKPNTIDRRYVIFGTAVKCVMVDGFYTVIDLDGIAAAEYLFGLNNRPQSSVDISQLDYGLLRPTTPASWRVMVTAAKYTVGGAIYSVPTLQTDNLQAYINNLLPGQARAVQVLVDAQTPALEVVVSDVFANSTIHDNVFINYPNVVGSNRYSAGWVKVYAGQTAITLDDLLPAPEILSKAAGVGGGNIAQQPEVIAFPGTVFANHQALWVDGFTVGTGGTLTVAGRIVVFSV